MTKSFHPYDVMTRHQQREDMTRRFEQSRNDRAEERQAYIDAKAGPAPIELKDERWRELEENALHVKHEMEEKEPKQQECTSHTSPPKQHFCREEHPFPSGTAEGLGIAATVIVTHHVKNKYNQRREAAKLTEQNRLSDKPFVIGDAPASTPEPEQAWIIGDSRTRPDSSSVSELKASIHEKANGAGQAKSNTQSISQGR